MMIEFRGFTDEETEEAAKRRLIKNIEVMLDELSELCRSETFYTWRDEFEILKDSF